MAVVAMSAVPVISFGVAQVATSGNAFAASKTTTCTGGPGTVKFAAPGLSDQGSVSTSAKSTAKTTAGAITCTGKSKGSGTLSATKIKTTSTTKCSADSNPPPGCTGNPNDYVYDSATAFAAGSGTLYQSVPTTKFTIGSTSYVIANTASAAASTCASNEEGFVLTGHLTAPASQSGKATTVTACILGDAGTGTTGSFQTDLFGELSGNTATIITSGTFDPSDSSIVFQ
jgi:hypothetical protein